MAKYYIALFLVVGVVLAYVFQQDPCNQQFRTAFSAKYPSYEIVETSGEGNTEKVYCHVYYKAPDLDQIQENVWIYANTSSGWQFSGVAGSRSKGRVNPGQE